MTGRTLEETASFRLKQRKDNAIIGEIARASVGDDYNKRDYRNSIKELDRKIDTEARQDIIHALFKVQSEKKHCIKRVIRPATTSVKTAFLQCIMKEALLAYDECCLNGWQDTKVNPYDGSIPSKFFDLLKKAGTTTKFTDDVIYRSLTGRFATRAMLWWKFIGISMRRQGFVTKSLCLQLVIRAAFSRVCTLKGEPLEISKKVVENVFKLDMRTLFDFSQLYPDVSYMIQTKHYEINNKYNLKIKKARADYDKTKQSIVWRSDPVTRPRPHWVSDEAIEEEDEEENDDDEEVVQSPPTKKQKTK